MHDQEVAHGRAAGARSVSSATIAPIIANLAVSLLTSSSRYSRDGRALALLHAQRQAINK